MTSTLKRKAKKAEKIVIDFTPASTRVFMRRRTHTYLHLRDENGEGIFLTMESGSISVVRIPSVVPDGAKHAVYRVYFNREDFEDLEPYPYEFLPAVRKYHSSLLGRTAGAEAEMRKLLGIEALAAGVSDSDLAVSKPERSKSRKAPSVASEKQPGGYPLQALCEELGIDPTDARKYLRQQKAEKPGGRWEWASAEAAAPIRSILETMPKE